MEDIVKKRNNKIERCKYLSIRMLTNCTESRSATRSCTTSKARLLYEEQGFSRRVSISSTEKLTMR